MKKAGSSRQNGIILCLLIRVLTHGLSTPDTRWEGMDVQELCTLDCSCRPSLSLFGVSEKME